MVDYEIRVNETICDSIFTHMYSLQFEVMLTVLTEKIHSLVWFVLFASIYKSLKKTWKIAKRPETIFGELYPQYSVLNNLKLNKKNNPSPPTTYIQPCIFSFFHVDSNNASWSSKAEKRNCLNVGKSMVGVNPEQKQERRWLQVQVDVGEAKESIMLMICSTREEFSSNKTLADNGCKALEFSRVVSLIPSY